jgi:predicted PurR-regulated permease PerM
VRSLIYRGMSRDAAASLVTLAFLVLVGIVGVALMPRLTSKLTHWQDTVDRYVQGGTQLLDASLRGLERHSPPLARAKLADTVAARLAQSTGSIADHLEPVALASWRGRRRSCWRPSWPSSSCATAAASSASSGQCRAERLFREAPCILLHEIDRTARAYFQGLINLTILDTMTLAAGLWLLGIPGPLALGLICAVLAWVPYVGSILGGLLVVLVAATDFPLDPGWPTGRSACSAWCACSTISSTCR